MPYLNTGTQYSGIWTLQQVDSAIAAGTWTGIPNLFTWGSNVKGQLGLSNTTNYSSPKQVGTSKWRNVYSGVNGSAFAVGWDGTLWAWGRNDYGQLGIGNSTYYSSPKQVGSLTNWLTISSGNYSTVAVKQDGTLWVWGAGSYGALGLGNTSSYNSPKQVGGLTTWTSASAGGYGMAAIKSDNTLWAWGNNGSGQIGQGNVTNYSSPKQIGALTNWLQVTVAGGGNRMLAVKTDGTLWSWGDNTGGALGIGNTTRYSSPKQVGSLTNWLNVSSAYYHSLALKTDGTLWSWGSNPYGQLGDSTTYAKSSPIQIGALTTWKTVSTGNSFSSGAINTSGQLWVWGYNNTGMLGLGNTTNYSSPKQLGSQTGWKQVSMAFANSTIALNAT